MDTRLNNYHRFLIISCKETPSEKKIALIDSYLYTGDFKLNLLLELAYQHGILPLVYKTLKEFLKTKAICNDKGSILLRELKPVYMQISQINMLMSAELIHIMKVLKESEIEALPFKGPVLSQMAYGNITSRQYSDLDILIKKNDSDKIVKILKSQGYEEALSLTSVQKKNWFKHAKDIGLLHTQKGIHIELHWLLLDDDYPVQIDLTKIWEYPNSVMINRQKIPTFPTESLLFYLCIHGSKHLWERIEWIKDIDLILRTQTIDWELVTEQINQSGFKRMFLLGLYLSHSLFQTPLPTLFKQQMQHQNWLIKLSDFIITDWGAQRNMFHNSLAMIHLFPSIKMKLLYLKKVILKPSQNEYRFIDLPKGLYWAYYLVRPYLLIKKYLTKK